MSTPFSDTSTNTGIVQQTRSFARVDSTQWPTQKIANSSNNWKDFLIGYMIGADKRFQWDDTNHTAEPEGTSNLTVSVVDYSFLTDQQGNQILTLLGLSILQNGKYVPLKRVDRDDPNYDPQNFGTISGTPTEYDLIADNIVRLNRVPSATVSAGLKYYFQRVGSYYSASDTTKTTGVPPILDRGFIIASAYDCALTLGLKNLSALAAERSREEERVVQYFTARDIGETRRLVPGHIARGDSSR